MTAVAVALPATAGAVPVPLGPNGGWVEGAGSAYQCVINGVHVVCNRQWPFIGGVQSWGAVNVRLPENCRGISMAPGSFTDGRPTEIVFYNPDSSSPVGCTPAVAQTIEDGWCAHLQPDDRQPRLCDGTAGQNVYDDRWVSEQPVWLGGVRYGVILRLY